MKVLIDDLNEFYGEKIRLVRSLMKRKREDEFPELLKWKLQVLYLKGDWNEICRIDNYPHKGKIGSHIHMLGRVKWVNLHYNEAEKVILDISSRILWSKYKEKW